MSSCTKLCSVPTGLDINPVKPDSDRSTLWRDFVEEVRWTKGYRSMQYGYQLEKPDVLNWTIATKFELTGRDDRSVYEEWDDYEAAIDFSVNKSDNHVRIYEKLKPWMRGRMTVLHVEFVPHGPVYVTAALVTEKLLLYFDRVMSGQEHQDQIQRFQAFEKARTKDVAETREVIGGWAVEEIERDGRARKVFVIFVAWESIEAREVAMKRLVNKETFGALCALALDVERCLISFRD